jgi:hypothetical protein
MRKILVAGGLTAAAVAAVVGAASTNSITGVSAQTLGYSSANITGAAVDSVVYNVNPTSDDVLDSVTITFHSALALNQVIKLAFNSGTLTGCNDVTNTDGAGTVTTSVATFTCALSGQTASGASKFRLLVTG